ncbi:carbohydrate ABC transporter permease [Jiangella alkaliphila]|uniref:Putative aldouronate transport system permease protein n=1 Tax=Jiangella alkaliphila TaxID=419479 RepID=A0A1H2L8I7_9ACTN|nr:carbohydrate ABC transporter permease [Jiangella alkaliphila]SDU76888.1 putative aldouronate transport system permease protein [Jiangella alkaliphila]
MTTNRRPPWMERPRPVTVGAKGVALVVLVLLVTVPFLVVVSTSLASQAEVDANGGWVLWPQDPSLHAYREILAGGVVTRALTISAGVTLFGTLASLTVTALLAYALSRPVVGGRPVMVVVLLVFVLPPAMIPTYLVVQGLGMLNTWPALVAPVLVSVFNLVVMRGFFQGIPDELYDAAKVDGAGELQTLVRIVLPLSKAVLAVVGLFYAVGFWNAFFSAILYLHDSSMWPIQAVLRQYVLQGATLEGSMAEEITYAPQSIQMAVLVLATLPIVCVYPFLQRHFVKGVLTGAVKT